MTFFVSDLLPDPPKNMSLAAKLAWESLFGKSLGSWQVVHTTSHCWIVTDESDDLTEAEIYPDDDTFVLFLEDYTNNFLENDALNFLRMFTLVPDLINDTIGNVMKEFIQESITLAVDVPGASSASHESQVGH